MLFIYFLPILGTNTVISAVIAVHNRAVVTADGQHPMIGSDWT